MNWHTKTLPLTKAKQLLAAVKKPGKKGAWCDYGGEDGVLTEVDHEHLSFEQLKKIQLPEFCCCIRASSQVTLNSVEDFPVSFDVFRKGSPLWQQGASNFVRVRYISRRFNSPVSVCFSQETESQYSRTNWDAACEFTMSWGTRGTRMADREGLTSKKDWPEKEQECTSEMNSFIQKYAIPQDGSEGVIIVQRYQESMRVIMNLQHPWVADNHEYMIRELCKEDALGPIHLTTSFSLGAALTWVKGGKQNIRNEALEIIELMQKREDSDDFSVLYSMLKPEDWRKRETRRKKWKEPILQELGNLTLENQTIAQVRILIEKDGYVFIIDFSDDDEAMLFPDTRLFKKVEWHSDVE